jgi:hypothetical protein
VSRSTRALLTIAQTGQAHLFFGLLYESVVRIPDRLSSERVLAGEPGAQPTLRSVLRPGSPALYFLPGGPVTLAHAIATIASRTALKGRASVEIFRAVPASWASWTTRWKVC